MNMMLLKEARFKVPPPILVIFLKAYMEPSKTSPLYVTKDCDISMLGETISSCATIFTDESQDIVPEETQCEMIKTYYSSYSDEATPIMNVTSWRTRYCCQLNNWHCHC